MDVEWEDLQAAFLSTREDRAYYLDRETGEVVSLSESDQDDEGTEDSEDSPAVEEGDQEAEENLRLEFENDPDRFVEVSPVADSDMAEWMNAFIHTVKLKELAAQLPRAVNGHQPGRDFERALRKVPTERARWIGFLESQVQEVIGGWLEENDIESDTPPPWKPKAPRRRAPKKASEPE